MGTNIYNAYGKHCKLLSMIFL